MASGWQSDKRWSDRFIPEIGAICGRHLIQAAPVASALTWQTQVAGARAADMSGCTAGAQGNCHRQRRRLTGEQCRQMARDLAEIGGAI